MARKMSWKECIDQGIITRTTADQERSSKMVDMARTRLEFWKKVVEERYLAMKLEAYYEIIKELMLAHLYKTGYNCSNHLCLIAYISKHLENFEFEAGKIDELRQLRNEISYRGFQVSKDYVERNETEFAHIIDRLIDELKK